MTHLEVRVISQEKALAQVLRAAKVALEQGRDIEIVFYDGKYLLTTGMMTHFAEWAEDSTEVEIKWE